VLLRKQRSDQSVPKVLLGKQHEGR
jgi:hypothetical protein